MIARLGKLITKSRSTPDVVVQTPQSVTNFANGTSAPYGTGYPVTTEKHEEWIRYTTHPDGNRTSSNWCQHLVSRSKYHGSPSQGARVDWVSPAGSYDQPYYGHHGSSMDWLNSMKNTLLSNSGDNSGSGMLSAQGQSFINEAAFKLRPDLTTMSMPNFLLEIGQLKSLFKIWSRNSSVSKNLAGAHLNYSYGWVPTIGDARAMLDVVRNTEAKLKAFERSIGQVFTGSIVLKSSEFADSGTTAVAAHVGVQWKGSVTRLVKAHLKWTPVPLKAMDPVVKLVRAYADALGFELNARVVWDALPLSFVLDNFIKFGDYIEQFSFDTLELPIRFVDSCVTYREVIKVECVGLVHGQPYCSDAIGAPVHAGPATLDQSYFERVPLLPDSSGFTLAGWKSPKLGQWLKLVSLATVLSQR